MNDHLKPADFEAIISHSISQENRSALKAHIDNCSECWDGWQHFRWDRASSHQGIKELREFLGTNFIEYYDSSWALADEWNASNRTSREEIEDFYKKTQNYLYNQSVFYSSGDRYNFKPLIKQLRSMGLKSAMDYGCGVGNDSLDMVEEGINTISVDLGSPSLDFLKWRLGKRGISKETCLVLSVEELIHGEAPAPEVELFWAIDVLEHMVDPFIIFNYITKQTKAFAYFVDSDDKAGGRHPFHFTFPTVQFEERLRLLGFEKAKLSHEVVSVWLKNNTLVLLI